MSRANYGLDCSLCQAVVLGGICCICRKIDPLAPDPCLVLVAQEFTCIVCMQALHCAGSLLCLYSLDCLLNCSKHSLFDLVESKEDESGGRIHTNDEICVPIQ